MTKVFSPSVPVSQPVLTLSPPGTRTLVGNEVRLQCEVQRGSSPIWYQFFHEDVLLTKIEATSWRTKSYSFSVTAEHSGNYFCEANNGQGVQRSYTVSLNVKGKWTQLQHNQRQTISPTIPSSRDWRYHRDTCCWTSLLACCLHI